MRPQGTAHSPLPIPYLHGKYAALNAQQLSTAILLEIPGAEHAFDLIFNGPSNQLALYYTERFLAWALLRP